MDPILSGRFIVDGLLISTALGGLILLSLYVNPRIWIQDFPAPLRAALPPLSAAEKRQRATFGVLLVGSMIGALLLSTRRLRAANGGELSFGTALLHLYLLFTMFNLWDTLIIDWLVLSILRPQWAIPPGAEELTHLFPKISDHWKAFAKGLLVGVVFCLPLALVAML